MNACDFDAVVYDGEEYCTECLPEGVDTDSKDEHGEWLVAPIFATEEMDRYPVCCVCGEEHTYVSLTAEGRKAILSRGHMVAEVVWDEWFEVDGDNGTEWIPASLAPDVTIDFADRVKSLRDYVQSREIYSVERCEGWGCRMSAPGYCDCTEWTVQDSEQQAWDYLWEYHGDD